MITLMNKSKIEAAVLEVASEVSRKQRNLDWQKLDEYDLWHELISCILGSNTRDEMAHFFSKHLKEYNALVIESSKVDYRLFERNIFHLLSQSIFPVPGHSNTKVKYRYPKLKAAHIRKTAESLYQNGGSLKKLLLSSNNPFEARVKLVTYCTGVGPKQSSLFLRNICYADNLAILDTHVLKYMYILNLIDIPIKNVSTFKQYRKMELILQDYCLKANYKLSNLDIAIWIVMRNL